MAAPRLNVDREAVRVLAAAVGQREAARQMGLSENSVKSICHRAGDSKRIETAVAIKTAATESKLIAPNPAEVLEKTLAERKQQSRLGLSEYVTKMATQAGAKGTLKQAGRLKDVADIMGKVWPEQSGPQTAIQLNIMQIGLGNEAE